MSSWLHLLCLENEHATYHGSTMARWRRCSPTEWRASKSGQPNSGNRGWMVEPTMSGKDHHGQRARGCQYGRPPTGRPPHLKTGRTARRGTSSPQRCHRCCANESQHCAVGTVARDRFGLVAFACNGSVHHALCRRSKGRIKPAVGQKVGLKR
jgi:hypothetical protein